MRPESPHHRRSPLSADRDGRVLRPNRGDRRVNGRHPSNRKFVANSAATCSHRGAFAPSGSPRCRIPAQSSKICITGCIIRFMDFTWHKPGRQAKTHHHLPGYEPPRALQVEGRQARLPDPDQRDPAPGDGARGAGRCAAADSSRGVGTRAALRRRVTNTVPELGLYAGYMFAMAVAAVVGRRRAAPTCTRVPGILRESPPARGYLQIGRSDTDSARLQHPAAIEMIHSVRHSYHPPFTIYPIE